MEDADDAQLRRLLPNLPAPGPLRLGNPLAPDNTDTGFETDSDMMEMCDIPEIL
jgi:hypothetical protein